MFAQRRGDAETRHLPRRRGSISLSCFQTDPKEMDPRFRGDYEMKQPSAILLSPRLRAFA
jgi:hypothetical protein